MSCALTTPQVRDRIKTETRRDPATWVNLKPGDHLTLIEKGMGLKKGEKQVVLAEVIVVSNTLERLSDITTHGTMREGFPGWKPEQFISFYLREKGGDRGQMVRVIRWEYLT
jgi:hypothetical protein